MYEIKLNKRQKNFTLKKVQRNITLTQVGRRGIQGETGPQGPPGDPASNIVTSVNTQIGDVVLDANDVGADPAGTAAAIGATKVDKTTTVNGHALSSNVTVIASEVPFTGDAGISANNVQDAITEVRDDTDAALSLKANSDDVTSSLLLKEDVANKDSTTTLGTSDTFYPTQNAVKVYVDNAIGGIPGDAVASVFGRTGVVTSENGDYTASQVTNVAAGNISATTVQAALNELDTEKQPLITAGTTLQYYRGDKTFQTLNTSVVPEGSNLYYTDARAQSAITSQGIYVLRAGDTMTGTLNSRSVIPTGSAIYDVGSSSNYFGSGYINIINMTSSIYLDGTANTGYVTSNGAFLMDNPATGSILRFRSSNNFSAGLRVQKRGDGSSINNAVVSGAEIGYHQFDAWTGTQYRRMAYVIVMASGAATDTTGGGLYRINTRSTAGTEATRVQIDETGIIPGGNLLHNSGGSSNYFNNIYGQRHYFNSTAYMDGAVAGTMNVGAGQIGILATGGAATHSLTLGSTATGIALYNTSDQTTNYERFRFYWAAGTFNVQNELGGTGANRSIRIGVYSGGFTASSTSSLTQGFLRQEQSSAIASQSIDSVGGTLSSSSGIQYAMVIAPTISQTSTAGYSALVINTTESTTGSGTKLLADFQVGGTSRVNVDNTGKMSIRSGLSTLLSKVGGTIFTYNTDAGNTTTSETDLYTDSVLANTLGTNKDIIEARYAGEMVNSATATRQLKIYFAGTAIFDTGTLSLSAASDWDIEVMIIRVSATVVRYSVKLNLTGASLSAYANVGELTGLTLSNANILKITGQAAGVGAATNDIVARLGTVKWEPAP